MDGLFGPNDPPQANVAGDGCTACGQRLVHAQTCPVHPSNVETPPELHAAIASLVRIVNGDDYSGVSLVVERRPGGPGVDVKATLRPRVPSGTIDVKVVRGGDLSSPAGEPCSMQSCRDAGRLRPCNGPHDCAMM